jgi:hypothetical protein
VANKHVSAPATPKKKTKPAGKATTRPTTPKAKVPAKDAKSAR